MPSQTQIIPVESIERAILLLRGEKVLLDRDLARLYGVSTSNLNKAVSRNLGRFPHDFMFTLIPEERAHLMFHSGTSSWGGSRKAPRAFSEELESKYDKQFAIVFDAIHQLMAPPEPRSPEPPSASAPPNPRPPIAAGPHAAPPRAQALDNHLPSVDNEKGGEP